MVKTLTAALATATLILAACGTTTTPAAPSGGSVDDLVAVTWLLEDLDGTAPVDGHAASVHFAEDGAVHGSGGCNRFSGTYEISDGTLTIGELPTTMMACSDDVMAVESAFLTALAGASGFAVDGETMTLTDEAGVTLGTFSAQSQELAGSQWAVTAYNDGTTAVVSLIEGTEANLSFADDGTLSGTAGCNQVIGSYTAGDGTITFDPLATTQMACPTPEGVMEQEAAIVAALESAATYSIEGDVLEMRTADDAIAVHFTRG